MSSSTELDLALSSPIEAIRANILDAIEAANAEYQDRVAQLAAEHEDTVGRLRAALETLGGASTNGHGQMGTVVVDLGGVLREPVPPVVEPGDVEIDPSSMTVREFVRAVMSTRKGTPWTAQEVLVRMEGLGYNSGRDSTTRLATVRAMLSQLFRDGERERPAPGDYLMR